MEAKHYLSEKSIYEFMTYLNNISPILQDSREAILQLLSIEKVSKNSDLQSIGKTCKTIYFVQDGIARIYYYKEGKDITEYFAFANDIIIRAESLFTGNPSQKAIQAIEETTFIAIPSMALFKLFDNYPDIERLFRKLVERSLVDTIHRLESLQFNSAEERYKDLIEKAPHFIKTIPLKHIASYLGITQVSLSRIRASIS